MQMVHTLTIPSVSNVYIFHGLLVLSVETIQPVTFVLLTDYILDLVDAQEYFKNI